MWRRLVERIRSWFSRRSESAPAPRAEPPAPPDVVELEGDERTMLFALARTRPAVSSFCSVFEHRVVASGVGEDALRAFQVAFDELLTNVVSYAEGGGDEPMGVAVERGDGYLLARIRYRAAAYDPTVRDKPDTDSGVADRAIGGLGVYLVQTMMDEFTHAYEDGYNVLTLRKRC
jgi:anti-sigma regulatory factor (Ser/Thr protein kinase)